MSNPYIPCTVPTWVIFDGDGGPISRPVIAWLGARPCVAGLTSLHVIRDGNEGPDGQPRVLFLTNDDMTQAELDERVKQWKAREVNDDD